MPTIGPLELVVILIIALVVFGPKRLPELGSSLGRGIREFRSSVSGSGEEESSEGRAAPRPELRGTDAHGDEASEPVDGEIVSDKRD